MQNSVFDPQDQRIASCPEDSTAMTIEFLRARLLSERSISKSARQRADELAKKVMELEEQLRMVILQRKMAEKATADVLAILENQGINGVSDEFDSGSDLENPFDSMSNDCSKENDGPMNSKGRQHGSDELSGSSVDSSLVSSKSLSWKGRHDLSHSLEKYKIKTTNVRRQNSFSSFSSSPKHHLGKSCRKIRHRQPRSVMEESRDKFVQVNCQVNELVSSSEGFPNFQDGGSDILKIESKIQEENGSEANLLSKNRSIDGYGREKEMEKALEHQAQLIDQYEAMEKAQREWEDKFRENNSTTPDSCDPGNQSDMTEDKDEGKVQIPYAAKVVTSKAEESKGEPRGVCLSEEKFKAGDTEIMPETHDDTDGYRNQKSATFSTSDLLGQENSHSPLKGNQNESLVNDHSPSSDMSHLDPGRHSYSDPRPTHSFPTDIHGVHHQNDASENKTDLYALVTREQSHKFDGVLESLKQARISLQQELNRLPVVEGGYTAKPLPSVSKNEDRFEIPIGCSGLFRLPTDFSDEATARFNVRDPTAGFGSNYHLNGTMSRTSDGQFLTYPPYSGTTSSLSADDQALSTRYLENGPRFSSNESPFDPFSNGGPLSSSKYSYPTFPINPSYENATPQMPFGDEVSRPYSNSTVGIPLANRFSFNGDHLR
ncbi:uncharacterized protein LOC124842953 isoform X3 [Vigna umbellata]|uniref:uncharacterized protein LOC124842953 isoform X1 n=3 Tax=Vigna umbellata TaxID=87088 RepID=UPI001F5F6E41|nr:uncharacterized protein LOC124842953 isoform X1 [Vigna umbellata]XP_047175527.1 uncharacterized protein LOC124842953 isoform X2 [Vigna umbellata]XP_047175528.1 uncharacterized protein LOC124842953 isoform X3 [Vigna umbellata]